MSTARMSYADKLKDPRWQKRRLKVMEYAHWRCQICGAKDNTLHCHHSYYTRGKEPWQYPDGAIICVCDPCHDRIHPNRRKKQEPPAVPAIIEVPELPPVPAVDRFAAMKAILDAAPDEPPEPRSTEEIRAMAPDAFAKIKAILAAIPDPTPKK